MVLSTCEPRNGPLHNHFMSMEFAMWLEIPERIRNSVRSLDIPMSILTLIAKVSLPFFPHTFVNSCRMSSWARRSNKHTYLRETTPTLSQVLRTQERENRLYLWKGSSDTEVGQHTSAFAMVVATKCLPELSKIASQISPPKITLCTVRNETRRIFNHSIKRLTDFRTQGISERQQNPSQHSYNFLLVRHGCSRKSTSLVKSLARWTHMEADFKLRLYDQCPAGVYIFVWRSSDLAKFESKMDGSELHGFGSGGSGFRVYGRKMKFPRSQSSSHIPSG